jgi:hypothetical protein
VVVVDVDITGGLDLKVDQRVARKERQHVVEKGHPGADFGYASAVEIYR